MQLTNNSAANGFGNSHPDNSNFGRPPKPSSQTSFGKCAWACIAGPGRFVKDVTKEIYFGIIDTAYPWSKEAQTTNGCSLSVFYKDNPKGG